MQIKKMERGEKDKESILFVKENKLVLKGPKYAGPTRILIEPLV